MSGFPFCSLGTLSHLPPSTCHSAARISLTDLTASLSYSRILTVLATEHSPFFNQYFLEAWSINQTITELPRSPAHSTCPTTMHLLPPDTRDPGIQLGSRPSQLEYGPCAALPALHADPRAPLLTYLPLCSLRHVTATACWVQPALSRLYGFPRASQPFCATELQFIFQNSVWRPSLLCYRIAAYALQYSNLLTILYPFMTGLSFFQTDPK